jgi:hypothetical protein
MSSVPEAFAIREPASCERLVTSVRGDRGAAIEPGRVVVFDLPGLVASAEITLHGGLEHSDVTFAGELGRLLVLTRDAGQAVLYIVDPAGPEKLAELAFAGEARILGVAGIYVVVATAASTFVLDVTRVDLEPVALPMRRAPTAVGQLRGDRLLLATAGVLEEWSLAQRAPTRRLHLERPVEPCFLGGTPQRIWVIPRSAPDSLELVTLATRATRRIELPEPAAVALPHPSMDLVAMIGAHSRAGFVVNLTRSKPIVRLDAGPLRDLAWVGRGLSLVVKPQDRSLELVAVTEDQPTASTVDRGGARERPTETALRQIETPLESGDAEASATQWTRDEISARLAAWRQRFQPGERVEDKPLERTPVAPSSPTPDDRSVDRPGGWRAQLASWSRTLRLGAQRPPPEDRGLLDVLRDRLALDDELAHGVALLYGAYLCGFGPTPVADLAAVLAWRWDEALGDGELAASGVVRWRRGGASLAPEVIAMLDERAPRLGELAGEGPAVLEPVAVVAPVDVAPRRVADWVAPRLGGLLVPGPRGELYPHRFLLEARLRGVAPLVRWEWFRATLATPPAACVLVVEQTATASELQLPVLATWQG